MGVLFEIIFVLLILHEGSGQQIVFQCNEFSPSDPLGPCDWNIIEILDEENKAATPDPDPAGNPDMFVLRAFYRNGSYAGNPDDKGGFEFWSSPFPPAEDMTLTYDVFFSENFDFVLGGKLPGFYGGTPESCNSTYCERCSGAIRNTCFSTRYMWDRNGEGYVYAYLPGDEGYGREIGRNLFWFKIGTWHTISQRLQMNFPGMEDGVLTVYFDGELIFTENKLKYREVPEVQISVLFFSTFFGGSSTPDYAAKADCYTYYRNFVVTLNE